MLCAWTPEGGAGICDSDVGGPLFTGSGTSATVVRFSLFWPPSGPSVTQFCPSLQWGIASWGYLCGEAGYPSVFTEVTHFLDWIAQNNQP